MSKSTKLCSGERRRMPEAARREILKWGAAAPFLSSALPFAYAAGQSSVLRITRNSDVSNMDPIAGNSGWDHSFLWTIYDSLTDFDNQTLLPKPGLADFEFTSDTTLVLKIKPGIVFHDGQPCDAAAVKMNLDRSRVADVSNIKADLANIEAVEVTGPRQVTIQLRQPDFTLPAVLSDRAGMMISPAAIEEFEKTGQFKPIGAGPWKLEKWVPNDKFVVIRHDQYWRKGFPRTDSIDYTIIKDYSAELRSLAVGENDFAYRLPPRYVPLIEKNPKLVLSATPSLLCLQLYFNWASGPIANPKVRQAINYALDKEAFIRSAYGGYGEPAHMQVPESHWAFDKRTSQLYEHDLDRARALMREAGYPDGVEIVVGGYNRSDTIRYNTIVTEQLAKAGIRCKFVTGLGASDINNDFWGKKKFDALLSWWTGRPDPSITYKQMYGKEGYFNASSTEASPKIARLLDENQQKQTVEERKQVLAELQYEVMSMALSAPIAFESQVAAYRENVKGYEPNLQGKPKFASITVE